MYKRSRGGYTWRIPCRIQLQPFIRYEEEHEKENTKRVATGRELHQRGVEPQLRLNGWTPCIQRRHVPDTTGAHARGVEPRLRLNLEISIKFEGGVSRTPVVSAERPAKEGRTDGWMRVRYKYKSTWTLRASTTSNPTPSVASTTPWPARTRTRIREAPLLVPVPVPRLSAPPTVDVGGVGIGVGAEEGESETSAALATPAAPTPFASPAPAPAVVLGGRGTKERALGDTGAGGGAGTVSGARIVEGGGGYGGGGAACVVFAARAVVVSVRFVLVVFGGGALIVLGEEAAAEGEGLTRGRAEERKKRKGRKTHAVVPSPKSGPVLRDARGAGARAGGEGAVLHKKTGEEKRFKKRRRRTQRTPAKYVHCPASLYVHSAKSPGAHVTAAARRRCGGTGEASSETESLEGNRGFMSSARSSGGMIHVMSEQWGYESEARVRAWVRASSVAAAVAVGGGASVVFWGGGGGGGACVAFVCALYIDWLDSDNEMPARGRAEERKGTKRRKGREEDARRLPIAKVRVLRDARGAGARAGGEGAILRASVASAHPKTSQNCGGEELKKRRRRLKKKRRRRAPAKYVHCPTLRNQTPGSTTELLRSGVPSLSTGAHRGAPNVRWDSDGGAESSRWSASSAGKGEGTVES
ncbi:hypothetical protein B0H11DRAFT_2345893 [Mycena galericulata]|nr:hypothetical protein B0H11DRAFT_2345893 [Mycena galericulata]